MEILSVLLSFGSLLNFAFMQELFTLIIKGVAFAESNYNHEEGSIQKQKCIEFIAQGYNVLDSKFIYQTILIYGLKVNLYLNQ